MRPIPLPVLVNLRGVSFYQEAVKALRAGELLVALAVDDNPHDADAVEVRVASTGDLVGFIPKELAPRLRASGAAAWSVTVDEVLYWDTTGVRTRINAPLAREEIPRMVTAARRADAEPAEQATGTSATLLSGRTIGVIHEVLANGDVVVATEAGVVRIPSSALMTAH